MTEKNPFRSQKPKGKHDTQGVILESAARLFAEEGYARATTKKIAEASGFTEMTLFRHFGSKKNLFEAVLEQYAIPENFEQIMLQNMKGPYRQDLMLFGRYLLEILLERRAPMQMMLCEASHFPDLQEVLGRVPARLRSAAASYFAKRVEEGEIVARDPDLLAQAFIGFFFSYAVGSGILETSMKLDIPKEQLVEEFVDLIVQGTVKPQESLSEEKRNG